METQHVTPIAQAATAVQDPAANYTSELNAFMSAGQALLDVWQSRVKDGLATGQRLLESGSPQSALEIQLDYAKAALQAYTDQSTKIAGLLSHAWTDSLTPKASAQKPGGANNALAA
jgi:hypothetical protein